MKVLELNDISSDEANRAMQELVDQYEAAEAERVKEEIAAKKSEVGEEAHDFDGWLSWTEEQAV